MAIRYSGKGKVRLTYSDSQRMYICRVSDGSSTPGNAGFARGVTVTVGHPATLERAVDAPESYDEAARAAIAFATDREAMIDQGDQPLDADGFALTDTGTWVGRSPETAWPPAPPVPGGWTSSHPCKEPDCTHFDCSRCGAEGMQTPDDKGPPRHVCPKGPASRDDLEALLGAAAAHGRESEPDHEIGDLHGILRAAWELLTPAQKRQLWDSQRDLLDQWGGS